MHRILNSLHATVHLATQACRVLGLVFPSPQWDNQGGRPFLNFPPVSPGGGEPVFIDFIESVAFLISSPIPKLAVNPLKAEVNLVPILPKNPPIVAFSPFAVSVIPSAASLILRVILPKKLPNVWLREALYVFKLLCEV